jgi:hypothetical protein
MREVWFPAFSDVQGLRLPYLLKPGSLGEAELSFRVRS